ncbi:MAG: hypothetical protein IGBAC_0557 [Ignavibacteriae bacterium]|nr:MAG: hypothetical protein IGBAC_0557 [Ignavibacteriota bacterium]
MKLSVLLVLLLISTSFVFNQIIKPSSLQAFSDGSVITIKFNTESELNVEKFYIERRQGTDGAFIRIASLNPKGPSLYEYIDQTAFKSSANIYQYQIRVTFSNGNVDEVVGPITVSHSVNSVKRTWGSIKAMFR